MKAKVNTAGKANQSGGTLGLPQPNLQNAIMKENIPMAEKAKTATTTPKPRKAATKKAAVPANVTEINAPREQKVVSRDEIAALAHKLWLERGRQHGQDADDWFRAEQLLRGKAS